MPRLLYLLPSFAPSPAADEAAMLVAGLADSFEIHLAAWEGGTMSEALAELAASAVVLRRRRHDWRAPWAFQRTVRRVQPDLVQCWGTETARAARLLAGRSIRWLTRVTDVALAHPGWQLPMDSLLARRTERMICAGEAIRQQCLQRRLPADKLIVIPPAVHSPESSAAGAEDTRALRRRFKLPDDARLIVTAGTFHRHLRFKDLIWAADLLKVIHDDTHLLIAGDGPQFSRLLRFREQVRIEDRVHFLGPSNHASHTASNVDLATLDNALRGAAMFWAADIAQAQASAILAAMAAGVPVIATDQPAHRELVIDGETGYLVPIGDRAAFASRSQKLLASPQLARRLGENGRRRACDQFNPTLLIDRFANLYEDLLR